MSNFPTPHINAKPGDIAKTIIMPGDPLRAQYIAEAFLEDAKLFNNVRGVQGYTGKYKGKTVSVMAHGMGMPSMALYAHELYDVYEVENILRIGTVGSLQPDLNLMDVILAEDAATDSAMAEAFGYTENNLPGASPVLIEKAKETFKEIFADKNLHCGKIVTSDFFYHPQNGINEKWRDEGILAIDMETSALYMTAEKFGKNALAICTVSNRIFEGGELSSMERTTGVQNMITLALELSLKL